MIQKDYEYVQGSTARQLKYDVYEDNKILKEKKRYKNNRKVKLKLVMAILSVLLACLTVMYRYAVITKLNYDINEKIKRYGNLKNENAMLKVQIETETDLSEIKNIAETRLCMQSPDKSQIVYIRVPRNDYTVMMDTQRESTDNGNAFGIFVNKVAGLMKLFE